MHRIHDTTENVNRAAVDGLITAIRDERLERAHLRLLALYIEHGEISHASAAKLTGLSVKSIRNTVCDLRNWGYFPSKRGFIYFVQDGDAVKIGFSANVDRRVTEIAAAIGHEVKLIAAFYGTLADEAKFHYRFRHLHIKGEWFTLSGDIKEFLSADCNGGAA